MTDQMPEWLVAYMPFLRSVLVALIIFIIGWIASKWAASVFMKVGRKRNLDEALSSFLASMIRWGVLAAAVIISLEAVGLETTSLVAVFASAGLAVGLALQGNLSNFASGVMILIFRPIDIGDKIKIDGVVGDVTDIGIFTTTMLTFENEKVIMPNSLITGGMIVNYTQPEVLRGGIDVGIAYGSDVPKAMDVMLKSAQRADLVLQDPKPHVAFVGLGASSLDFKVYAWSKSADHRDMFHTVRSAIYADLEEAGIEIPFTQLVLHKADEA